MCGRRLKCGNHKCPAPCHRGLCAPCPINVQISCACGATCIQVPCGTERTQRPPRCVKLCSISPKCNHGSNCKPHRCHYGACPECQLPCMTLLPCGHNCKERWYAHRVLNFGVANSAATRWLVEIIFAEIHAILSPFHALWQGKKFMLSRL